MGFLVLVALVGLIGMVALFAVGFMMNKKGQ